MSIITRIYLPRWSASVFSEEIVISLITSRNVLKTDGISPFQSFRGSFWELRWSLSRSASGLYGASSTISSLPCLSRCLTGERWHAKERSFSLFGPRLGSDITRTAIGDSNLDGTKDVSLARTSHPFSSLPVTSFACLVRAGYSRNRIFIFLFFLNIRAHTSNLCQATTRVGLLNVWQISILLLIFTKSFQSECSVWFLPISSLL